MENEKSDPVEDAKKLIEQEKKERAERCGNRLDELLEEANCELHFTMQYSSVTGKVVMQRGILPK